MNSGKSPLCAKSLDEWREGESISFCWKQVVSFVLVRISSEPCVYSLAIGSRRTSTHTLYHAIGLRFPYRYVPLLTTGTDTHSVSRALAVLRCLVFFNMTALSKIFNEELDRSHYITDRRYLFLGSSMLSLATWTVTLVKYSGKQKR